MLPIQELKTAMVDLLGEQNTEWKPTDVINAFIRKTGEPFTTGSLMIHDLLTEGTINFDGKYLTIANRELEEVCHKN